MKIGELFVRLGVQADTFTVKDFVRAIGDIPFSVAAAVTSLAGMSLGFVDLTKNTLELGNNLSMFRAETGLSTQELQRWQTVAAQVGMSGDSITQAITRITNAMAQMRLGHFDQGFMLALGQLGVNTRGKSGMQVFQEVLERTGNMNPQIGSAMLSNLGLSPELMRIATLSPEQRNRMMSVGPALSEGDIRAMQDFQGALGRFTIVLEQSFVPVLTKLEPHLADLAELLGDLIQLLGSGASAVLGDVHKFMDARKHGVGLFSGDATGYFPPTSIDKSIESNVYVTQNIHSTADPHEVARVAHEHFKREKANASKSIGNSGY